jgi:hypothetical protein
MYHAGKVSDHVCLCAKDMNFASLSMIFQLDIGAITMVSLETENT